MRVLGCGGDPDGLGNLVGERMHIVPSAYVAIDLETGGLPKEDKKGNKDFSAVPIVRISAVGIDGIDAGGFAVQVQSAFDEIVKTDLPVSKEALRVNGLTEEQIAKGMTLGEAIEKLDAYCFSRYSVPAMLIGQNIMQFDLPLLRMAGFEMPEGPVVLDTKAMWVAWQVGLRRGRHEPVNDFMLRASLQRNDGASGLDHLAQTLLGKDDRRTGAHDSVQDAILTARVLEAMRARGILADLLGED
jgi:DNA polymerase III epsilon subunit-like protein